MKNTAVTPEQNAMITDWMAVPLLGTLLLWTCKHYPTTVFNIPLREQKDCFASENGGLTSPNILPFLSAKH